MQCNWSNLQLLEKCTCIPIGQSPFPSFALVTVGVWGRQLHVSIDWLSIFLHRCATPMAKEPWKERKRLAIYTHVTEVITVTFEVVKTHRVTVLLLTPGPCLVVLQGTGTFHGWCGWTQRSTVINNQCYFAPGPVCCTTSSVCTTSSGTHRVTAINNLVILLPALCFFYYTFPIHM